MDAPRHARQRRLIARLTALTVLVVAAMVAQACGRGEPVRRQALPLQDVTTTSTTAPPQAPGRIELAAYPNERCDQLDRSSCLLPYPSDHFTVADPLSATGRTLNLALESMPANSGGVHIDPRRWNDLDGFSPATPIVVSIPDLDVANSNLDGLGTAENSTRPGANIVIWDAIERKRVPYWVDVDASQPVGPAGDRLLVIRPAVLLTPGHRIVVGIRNLVDSDGELLPPSRDFEAYRDRRPPDEFDPIFDSRIDAMDSAFDELRATNVRRNETLQLAWSFTVASVDHTTEDLTEMVDTAMEALGDGAPAFTIDSVEETVPPELLGVAGANATSVASVGLFVQGTVRVPRFLTGDGGPGSVLSEGPDELPRQTDNDTTPYNVAFTCVVPSSVVDDPTGAPARLALFGHDFLGVRQQVASTGALRLAQRHRFIMCGTDSVGMSDSDRRQLLLSVADLSNFASIPDRLKQSVVNALFLGRLMTHEQGLSAQTPFLGSDGEPLIDNSALHYYGIGQGAVMGPTLAALSDDIQRAALVSGGSNLGLIFDRSAAFAPLAEVLDATYSDPAERTVTMALAQSLWDGAEGAGFLPLLGDDDVLLVQADYGDHQVPVVASTLLARSLDLPTRVPVVADDRQDARTDLFWGLTDLDTFPGAGSGYTVFDSGGPIPPLDAEPLQVGRDPHTDPQLFNPAVNQVSKFLEADGTVTNPCGDGPCTITR